MLDFSVLEPYFPLLINAVWITLKFTFFSTIMGFIGGLSVIQTAVAKSGI